MKKLPIILTLALSAATVTSYAVDDAYKSARKQAKDTYEMDRKACKDKSGDERHNCLNIAKQKRDAAIADAKKLKTHGARLHGDASQTEQSYSKLPASGAGIGSQPRTAGNQPGQFMGDVQK